MSDGRLIKGPLHPLISGALELGADLDLCAHVYGPNAKSRGELAQLSRLVSDAAAKGDPAALGIFDRAGRELAQIADAMRRTLGFEPGEPVRVTRSGGAFAAGDLLLRPFEQALQGFCPTFELRPSLHEPHIGAALYARKLGTA
jgi:N-acetylglucosamine kinase-like BadF-type ATPase